MRATRLGLVRLATVAALAVGWTVPALTAPNSEFELYFELKLLARPKGPGAGAVDQWAGGVLHMRAVPAADGATWLRLVRPIEDPWIFRWYDRKNEVKLGAAVWVAEPTGDAYGALAPTLERDARRRYDLWWESDRVAPLGPCRPGWQSLAESFWADRHTDETTIRDPLAVDPVYPFHVLGPLAGRFALLVERDGSVRAGSVRQSMTEPWLADGWRRWLAGERPAGYGYWDRERPAWEPRTYEAFAAAVGLLEWPMRDAPAGATVPLPRMTRRVAEVVEALAPRARGRIRDGGALSFVVGPGADPARPRLRIAESGALEAGGLTYRIWRCQELPAGPSDPPVRDELQVLARRAGGDFGVWIRVGYRPVGETPRDSGGPLKSSRR